MIKKIISLTIITLSWFHGDIFKITNTFPWKFQIVVCIRDSEGGKARSRENVPQLHRVGTYILSIIIFCGGEEARREANERVRSW